MIGILDYGAGNLRSVQNTLNEIGAQYTLCRDAESLAAASKVILPGVGHFGQMMQELERTGLRTVVREQIDSGKPFLGICLGMQALFERSEEAPELQGFGLFPGVVKRFAQDVRCPHMGWNELIVQRPSPLLQELGAHPYVYFAHSYYAPVVDATVTTTEYTVPYTSSLQQGNVYGVQFHPEKSGPIGLRVVQNFVELS